MSIYCKCFLCHRHLVNIYLKCFYIEVYLAPQVYSQILFLRHIKRQYCICRIQEEYLQFFLSVHCLLYPYSGYFYSLSTTFQDPSFLEPSLIRIPRSFSFFILASIFLLEIPTLSDKSTAVYSGNFFKASIILI